MISPEVGYRLAALADGEGCFSISRINVRKANPGYVCRFIVKMRADDRPFLERMANEVGLGTIRSGEAWKGDGCAREPWVRWAVERKAGLVELTRIFDEYPLWSKKRFDYAIWRDAVLWWASCQPGERIDWTGFAPLYDALRDNRIYGPAEHETLRLKLVELRADKRVRRA